MTAVVVLAPPDLELAVNGGRTRAEQALARVGATSETRYCAGMPAIKAHTIGLLGEIAVARYLGRPVPVIAYHDDEAIPPGDVDDLEVRATGRPLNLLLNPRSPAGVYVLAYTHELPAVTLRGWYRWTLEDRARRHPRTLFDGGPPTYVIRPEELAPMSTLPRPERGDPR